MSSFDRVYEFQDHIVIIGEYEDYFISDICAEIAEIDKLQKFIDNVKREGVKIIIVGKDNPSN